jgi:tetratricopeptide (TPR) repeat protein
VLGLAALNAWWWWEERPLPEPREVARWLDAGRGDDAERALRAWVRRSPYSAEARLMLARALAGKGDLTGCAGQLRAVPFWSPLKGEALFREAQTWQQLKRAADAEAAFRRYLADDPNHPEPKAHRDLAEVELINLLTLEGRWDEARALIWGSFDRAASARQREELLVMVVRTETERYEPSAAVVPLRQFVTADPSDFEARLALATAAEALGRPAEADAQVAACLRLRPRDPRAWRARLEILKARADINALRRALAEAPAEVESVLWPYRGEVLVRDGDLAGAFDAYARAIAASPDEADLHYREALLARRLGRTQDEERALRRHQVLRAAREALPDAMSSFLKTPADRPDAKKAAAARLSELSKDLGKVRESQEWARLAVEIGQTHRVP